MKKVINMIKRNAKYMITFVIVFALISLISVIKVNALTSMGGAYRADLSQNNGSTIELANGSNNYSVELADGTGVCAKIKATALICSPGQYFPQDPDGTIPCLTYTATFLMNGDIVAFCNRPFSPSPEGYSECLGKISGVSSKVAQYYHFAQEHLHDEKKELAYMIAQQYIWTANEDNLDHIEDANHSGYFQTFISYYNIYHSTSVAAEMTLKDQVFNYYRKRTGSILVASALQRDIFNDISSQSDKGVYIYRYTSSVDYGLQDIVSGDPSLPPPGEDCQPTIKSGTCTGEGTNGYFTDSSSWQCIRKNQNYAVSNLSNPYCSVYCKEDVQLTHSDTSKVFLAGRFFTIGDNGYSEYVKSNSDISSTNDKYDPVYGPIQFYGKRTCAIFHTYDYSSGVDIKKFIQDYDELISRIVTSYPKHLKYLAEVEAVSKSEAISKDSPNYPNKDDLPANCYSDYYHKKQEPQIVCVRPTLCTEEDSNNGGGCKDVITNKYVSDTQYYCKSNDDTKEIMVDTDEYESTPYQTDYYTYHTVGTSNYYNADGSYAGTVMAGGNCTQPSVSDSDDSDYISAINDEKSLFSDLNGCNTWLTQNTDTTNYYSSNDANKLEYNFDPVVSAKYESSGLIKKYTYSNTLSSNTVSDLSYATYGGSNGNLGGAYVYCSGKQCEVTAYSCDDSVRKCFATTTTTYNIVNSTTITKIREITKNYSANNTNYQYASKATGEVTNSMGQNYTSKNIGVQVIPIDYNTASGIYHIEFTYSRIGNISNGTAHFDEYIKSNNNGSDTISEVCPINISDCVCSSSIDDEGDIIESYQNIDDTDSQCMACKNILSTDVTDKVLCKGSNNLCINPRGTVIYANGTELPSKSSVNEETLQKYYDCINTKCQKMTVIYRTIQLQVDSNNSIAKTNGLDDSKVSFPSYNANGRTPGANWNKTDTYANNPNTDISKGNVAAYITNNRNVYGNAVYSKNPLYEIELTPSIIKSIREYNKQETSNGNGGYADFSNSMTCDSNGRNCVSSFIHGSIYNFTGDCKNVSVENAASTFDACRYK